MSLPPFTYSPFPTSFEHVGAEHLRHLKRAAEGWHVDYKRDVPEPEKAAKSLSSFANTFGGWIIYGVDAPGGGSPLPTEFRGIAASEVHRVAEMLQRGAAHHVQPAPFFEARIIDGPDTDTGLPAGRSIVLVRVPPGAHAPYIHSSGRIYRRVADSSEPKHETDRHTLELLLDRSRAVRGRWRDLIETQFKTSNGEADQPFLHLFLSCDPYGDRGARLELSFDDFVKAMRDGSSGTGGLPFDNFFAAADGWTARQVAGNDPYQLVFTWRQRFDTTAIISVGIPHGHIDEMGNVFSTQFDGYDHVEAIEKACRQVELSGSRLLDLNFVPYVVHGVLQRYRALLTLARVPEDFFVKVRVDDIWRAVPFLDLAEHATFVSEHGVPIIQDSSAFAPHDVGSMVRMSPRDPNASADASDPALVDALWVLVGVSQALGVPLPVKNLVSELPALLERAKRVQSARNMARDRARR